MDPLPLFGLMHSRQMEAQRRHLDAQREANRTAEKTREQLKQLAAAQAKADEAARRAREAELRKPQCCHCGGRLPGRYDLCMHCSRNLYWGHPQTIQGFKTEADAQLDVQTTGERLKRVAFEKDKRRRKENEERREQERARRESDQQMKLLLREARLARQECDRHGVMVRSPECAYVASVVAVLLLGGFMLIGIRMNWTNPAEVRLFTAWCLPVSFFVVYAITLLIATWQISISPVKWAGIFLIEAICMALWGSPVWVYGLPIVTALTELFSAGSFSLRRQRGLL